MGNITKKEDLETTFTELYTNGSLFLYGVSPECEKKHENVTDRYRKVKNDPEAGCDINMCSPLQKYYFCPVGEMANKTTYEFTDENVKNLSIFKSWIKTHSPTSGSKSKKFVPYDEWFNKFAFITTFTVGSLFFYSLSWGIHHLKTRNIKAYNGPSGKVGKIKKGKEN